MAAATWGPRCDHGWTLLGAALDALRLGRLAAGPDEVPDGRPGVTAPPGDREPGWLEAADRKADDPFARVDTGVALGQQRYRCARGYDLELLISRTHLGRHPW